MSGIFNETMPEIEEIFVSFKGDKQVKSKKKERKYSWLPKDEAIGHECDDLIKATHDINECFDCGDKVKKKNLRQHIARLTDCLERLKQMKDDVEESKYQLEYEHSNAKGRINELIVVVENSDSEIEQLKVENEVLRSKAIESLILHNINYQT